MNTESPEWDADDPSGSFARVAEWLHEQARLTFLKDSTHIELFFLYRADGQGAITPLPANMERDQFVAALKAAIKEHDIYGVVHVSEAWTYFPKHPNDHTMTQVVQGEINVSQLRPGDRTEALTVHMESRDGAIRLWISPIIRTPTGVALADPMEMPEPPGGRFAGLFKA